MKVTMYKATDGTLVATQKERDALNAKLRLKPAAEAFVSGLPDGVFATDERDNAVIYVDDLALFIVNHADALRKLLNEAQVVRRPRKAKAKSAPQAGSAA